MTSVGRAPQPCQYCQATVEADLMQAHENWHAINDLHAASCQKAEQQTSVHLTPLPCTCGLK